METFLPTGSVVLGIDDTIERRRGKRIAAKDIYRDAVRSSEAHFVKSPITLAQNTPPSIPAPALSGARQPTANERAFGNFAPKFVDLTDNLLFGDIWERPDLSKRDRSLVTVAALFAMNCPDQLPFHLVRARENGVTQEQLVEAITHPTFYAGWPSAYSVITVAEKVLPPK